MIDNIGNTDRFIRIISGFIIIGLGADFGSWWGTAGLLPIFSALLRYCPFYHLLGISTFRKRIMPYVYPE